MSATVAGKPRPTATSYTTTTDSTELVALLLGRQPTVNGEREPIWHHAVTGGQRSVKLRRLV